MGATSIKLAGIRQKGRDFNLEFYERVDLIKEYSLESFFEVTDDHYIEQLIRLDSKYNLKNTRLSFALPANSAIIQTLKVTPSQTESELLNKIRHTLRQATSENFDEMQIACHELQDDSEKTQVPLLVCAIANDIIARYKRIISESGLKATVLDLDALGVYNAFYYFCDKPNRGPTVLVYIGAYYSICIILLPGRSPFFHLIRLGKDITKQVMNKIRSASKIAEAQESAIQKIFSDFSDSLLLEVKKCIRHVQSYEGISEFECLYLADAGAQLESLPDLFRETLQINTEIWNPIRQFIEPSQQMNSIYLIPAIGTALRGD